MKRIWYIGNAFDCIIIAFFCFIIGVIFFFHQEYDYIILLESFIIVIIALIFAYIGTKCDVGIRNFIDIICLISCYLIYSYIHNTPFITNLEINRIHNLLENNIAKVEHLSNDYAYTIQYRRIYVKDSNELIYKLPAGINIDNGYLINNDGNLKYEYQFKEKCVIKEYSEKYKILDGKCDFNIK